jgi:hypothetical protein
MGMSGLGGGWSTTVSSGGGGGTIGGGGTLDYIAKFTPDGTHIGNSQLFDNGTNIGIGTVTPSNYVDIVKNQANPTIVGVTNATTGIHASAGFETTSDTADGGVFALSRTNTTYPSTYQGNVGLFSLLSSTGIYANNDIFFTPNAGVEAARFVGATGFFGIGTSIPLAKTHILSPGSSSATVGFIVGSAASANSLYIRDDGFIGVSTTTQPISSVKLSINGEAWINGSGNSLYFNDAHTFIAGGNFSGAPFNAPGANSMLQYSSTGSMIHYVNGSSSNANEYFMSVPDGSGTIQNNMVILNNGNVGVGVNFVSPLSTMHIQSSGTGSGTYGFMVQNVATANVFSLRDDIVATFGNSGHDSDFYFNSSNYSSLHIQTSGTERWSFQTVTSTLVRENIYVPTRAFVDGPTNKIFTIIDSNRNWLFSELTNVVGTPLAKVHSIANTDTSSDYSFMATNSMSVPYFWTRGDGHVLMNALPTSAVGLTTGELWNNLGIVNIAP